MSALSNPVKPCQALPAQATAQYREVVPHDDLDIRPITPDDAGEVLTLQRAAFVQEALIYGTPHMPPLTQTLEEITAELVENLGCVAVREHRLVVYDLVHSLQHHVHDLHGACGGG